MTAGIVPRCVYPSQPNDNIVAHHITAEEAGVVFARVKPRLAVYAHISDADLITPARKSYTGPLEAGEDLMVDVETTTLKPSTFAHSTPDASRHERHCVYHS